MFLNKTPTQPSQTKQSGVALITALIITAIAVSLAGMVMYRQQIQIRLSSNIGHMEQAYLYANGMEEWAGTILLKSYKEHPKYDSFDDDWAQTLPPIPIPGGILNGQLYDLQARLNVNSLARPLPPRKNQQQTNQQQTNQRVVRDASGRLSVVRNQGNTQNNEPPPNIAKINRDRLQRLLQNLDPDEKMGPVQNFTDILKDWIDKDQINGNSNNPRDPNTGSGAESPYYQSLEPSYFSADTLMVSPTELLLLKDMDKEVYKKLKDFVTTLPIKDSANKEIKTPVNINTARVEVLQALGFDPADANKIYDHVQEKPFQTKKEFSDYIRDNIAQPPNDIEVDTGVNSQYFLLQGKVQINNARLFINSILERKNGRISVIMRDFSNQ